jgi:hypothetical protein
MSHSGKLLQKVIPGNGTCLVFITSGSPSGFQGGQDSGRVTPLH